MIDNVCPVKVDVSIYDIIDLAIKQNISDIHLSTNSKIYFRYGNKLMIPSEYQNLVTSQSIMLSYLAELVLHNQMKYLMENKHLDVSINISNNSDESYRARLHIFNYLHGHGMNIRLIYNKPRSFEELNLPGVLFKKWITVTNSTGGLIVIGGLTNQGKTTTMSTIINYINQEFYERIVIIEDPIEFIHDNIKSEIIQKEVYTHSLTYEDAIKDVLREDANTVAIGEIRTTEAMDTALTIAEAGFRVIITVHAKDCFEMIERIINMFPVKERERVCNRLFWVLCGVYNQKLITAVDSKNIVSRKPIYEYLSTDDTRVKLDIKKGDINHLKSVIKELPSHIYFTLDNKD